MDQFLQLISGTSIAGMVLLALVATFGVVAIGMYMLAFFQGREIWLWPPKLGARQIHLGNGGKSNSNAEGRHTEPQRHDRASLPSMRLTSKPIAVLEGVNGPVNGCIYIVITGHRDITVGKEPSCDLPINSGLLSRHHFRLRISLTERREQTGRGFIFELIDSGSTNGTFLNGTLVAKAKVVENGDLIEAGDCGFRFFTLSGPRE